MSTVRRSRKLVEPEASPDVDVRAGCGCLVRICYFEQCPRIDYLESCNNPRHRGFVAGWKSGKKELERLK